MSNIEGKRRGVGVGKRLIFRVGWSWSLRRMSRENDRVLRLYHEVLDLEHLHYGLWEEGEDVNLPNFRVAQQRFEDFLVERLPAGAGTFLDVGVGTGSLCKRLREEGKECHGLSPDINQKRKFEDELGGVFHHCRYEDWDVEEAYDCVVMSESAQYIWWPHVVEKSVEAVKPGGHLVIFDYFSLGDATGVFSKNGHCEEKLVALAAEHGFVVEEREDVTERMLKSLDLARDLAERGLKAFEIFAERSWEKRAWLMKMLRWMFSKKIAEGREKMQLIDSEEWRKRRAYVFLKLRREN